MDWIEAKNLIIILILFIIFVELNDFNESIVWSSVKLIRFSLIFHTFPSVSN